jgi:hypothetical protein
MKKYFVIAISIFFFRGEIFAQYSNPPLENTEQLSAIDKTTAEIKNNIGNYQKKEWSKDSTGYRNSYFNNGELQMAVTYYKDTATEKRGEWYFQDGKFIFSMKLWTDVKTKDTLDYERFYLSNEHLIAWFKFDTPVDRNTVAFKKLNYMMRDYIADLKRENQK